jgi:hypothetical protein
MPKDLYQSKKIVVGLSINYKKIDVCEKNCMLFWKENKYDTECMHCGKLSHLVSRSKLNAYLYVCQDQVSHIK